MDMFDMAFELGANFRIINVQVSHLISTFSPSDSSGIRIRFFHDVKSECQGLSPLTVAAFLAHTEMFFHILNIDRDIYWQVLDQQITLQQLSNTKPK